MCVLCLYCLIVDVHACRLQLLINLTIHDKLLLSIQCLTPLIAKEPHLCSMDYKTRHGSDTQSEINILKALPSL